MEKTSINGKVAIITGASRGIGEAIATIYAKAGAKVIISSRELENLRPVYDSIKAHGGDVLAIPCDTTDKSAVTSLVEQVIKDFGGVDILVNNAGSNYHSGPILTADESEWDLTFDVNLKGYFRMAKAVFENMKTRGGGKIINIASIAGITPTPQLGVYGLTKAAIIMMTKSLAIELAPENIQVNCIAPGFITTQFSAPLTDNEIQRNSILKKTPQNRIAGPEEVGELALYLASPVSNYMTGSINVIDGGLSIAGFEDLFV